MEKETKHQRGEVLIETATGMMATGMMMMATSMTVAAMIMTVMGMAVMAHIPHLVLEDTY
eukprot:4558297-Ditylum_brightwellii.AAC.1